MRRIFEYIRSMFYPDTIVDLPNSAVSQWMQDWIEQINQNPPPSQNIHYDEHSFMPYRLVNGERVYVDREPPEPTITLSGTLNPNHLNMSGMTFSVLSGTYNATYDYDPYKAPMYGRKELDSLLKLITFSIAHEETKLKVRETINQFEGDSFSKEDFDRLVVMVTLAIDDIVVSDRVEATYSLWKETVDF